VQARRFNAGARGGESCGLRVLSRGSRRRSRRNEEFPGRSVKVLADISWDEPSIPRQGHLVELLYFREEVVGQVQREPRTSTFSRIGSAASVSWRGFPIMLLDQGCVASNGSGGRPSTPSAISRGGTNRFLHVRPCLFPLFNPGTKPAYPAIGGIFFRVVRGVVGVCPTVFVWLC